MSTMVKEVFCFGKEERLFTTNKESIKIISSNEGIAKVIPIFKRRKNFISTLIGCLEKSSNFNFFFNNYYGENIKGFEFFLEGVDYSITPSTNASEIEKKILKNHVFNQKKEYRRQQIHKKIIELDETTEIQFKDKDAEICWKHIVGRAETNKELQSVAFARRYAKIMQYLISKNGIDNFEYYSSEIYVAINKDGIIETDVLTFTFRILRIIWAYGDEI